MALETTYMIGNLKSQVCLAGSIYEALILDIASGRSPVLRSSLLRDLQTIKHRLQSEGMQFCTITLPTLYKAIIKSFRTGKLEIVPGFKLERGTTLPRLFSGLLKEIYTGDGFLLNDASIPSITEVIQLTSLCYKLDIPCGDDKDARVVEDFLKTERDLESLTIHDEDDILELAETMISDIFYGFDPFDITPKHGPGAVSTGEEGREKWFPKRNFKGIHSAYPYFKYFYLNSKHLLDCYADYRKLARVEHGFAKILLVPKDSRGPRLISMEPLEYQYMQQGLSRKIVENLENLCSFTRGRVNFTDQTINRKLALRGSKDGTWATLDMKEASDRVSVALVRRLFKGTPQLLRCLLALRSSGTTLLDGTEIFLHKFAPMGSALCFPILSVVTYVLAVASIMYHTNLSRWEAAKSVRVYGDDLIIRSKYADDVMNDLPRYGLMFNRDKSFVHGPFRESCGMDAFKGVQITSIKWRKPWRQRMDAVTLVSFSQLASQFYLRGYVRAANLVWDRIEQARLGGSSKKKNLPPTKIGILPTEPLRPTPDHPEGQIIPVRYLVKLSRLPYRHTACQIRRNYEHQNLQHRAVYLDFKVTNVPWNEWSRLQAYHLVGSCASQELSPYSSLKKGWVNWL